MSTQSLGKVRNLEKCFLLNRLYLALNIRMWSVTLNQFCEPWVFISNAFPWLLDNNVCVRMCWWLGVISSDKPYVILRTSSQIHACLKACYTNALRWALRISSLRPFFFAPRSLICKSKVEIAVVQKEEWLRRFLEISPLFLLISQFAIL